MSLDTLNSAFKALRALEEDMFDTSLDGINKLSDAMDADLATDEVEVIDPEAFDEEELKDTYVGKIILNCNVCHSHLFANKEDITIDESGIVNGEEQCPYCGETEGFVILGQIEEYSDTEGTSDDTETEEDTTAEDTPTTDEQEPTEPQEEEQVKNESLRRNSKKRLNESAHSIDRDKLRKNRSKMNESEENPFANIRSNIIEFPNGDYVYVGYENGKMFAGDATNTGVFHRYELDYDHDMDVDANLSALYDYIIEQSPELLDECMTEAKDVTDQVIINIREPGFITKKHELHAQGYVVIGTGNGKIIMAKPKDIKEGISYGEISAIQSEWEKFKKRRGVNGKADASLADEFIDTECKGVYDTDEEKEEVRGVIGSVEEKYNKYRRGNKLTEAPYLEPQYDSRQSFYRKAFVDDKGGNDLYSYGVHVMTIKDGKPVITCRQDQISQTTLRHIKEFLKQKGFRADSKQQIIKDYFPTTPIAEDFRDSNYTSEIIDYFGHSAKDEFLDIVADLLDRVDDFSDEDEINDAVDSGLIYTDDQWVVYRHYCDMGDPVDTMWEGLLGDMYAICAKIANMSEAFSPKSRKARKLKEKLSRRFSGLRENINNATVETDDQKLTIQTDDNGKVTVSTEPVGGATEEDEVSDDTDLSLGDETIAPIDDTLADELLNNGSEEEVAEPAEEPTDVEGEDTTTEEEEIDTEEEETDTEDEDANVEESFRRPSRRRIHESKPLTEDEGEDEVDPEFTKLVDKLRNIKGYEQFVTALSKLNPEQKQLFKDNFGNGDAIQPAASVTPIPVANLFPTQNEIALENSLDRNLGADCSKFFDAVPDMGGPILTYDSKYIIDGHHRWSQVFAFNPKAKISANNFKYEQETPVTNVLKDFQAGVMASKEFELKAADATNVFAINEEQARKYIQAKIKDPCWQSLVKVGVATDKDSAVEYLVKNLMLMKEKNKPAPGAPDRKFMPQTDNKVPARMAQGITDMSEAIDIDFEDFDEEAFNELGERYLKKVYENVNSFKTTGVSTSDTRLVVEGVIKFKSGTSKKTGFVFEAFTASKDGKVKFLGKNSHLAESKKAFCLNGRVNNNRLVVESLSYNYRDKSKTRVAGKITRSK